MYTYPPTLVPEKLLFVNYPEAMTMAPFIVWFKNTVTMVFLSTLGTVFGASLAAFGFARFKFRFRDLLFMITLSTMMMPAQVTLIPRFILFYKIGEYTGRPVPEPR